MDARRGSVGASRKRSLSSRHAYRTFASGLLVIERHAGNGASSSLERANKTQAGRSRNGRRDFSGYRPAVFLSHRPSATWPSQLLDTSAAVLGNRYDDLDCAVLAAQSCVGLAGHSLRHIRARAYGIGFDSRGYSLAVSGIDAIFPLSACSCGAVLVGNEFRVALDILT